MKQSVYVPNGGFASGLFPLDKLFVIFNGKNVKNSTFIRDGSFVQISIRLNGGKGTTDTSKGRAAAL